MNRWGGLLSRAYRCLLRLYPAPFRAEFATEMEGVFAQAAADAARGGRPELARLCLRELLALPGAVAREWAGSLAGNLGGRKGRIMSAEPYVDDPTPTGPGGEAPSPWPHAVLAALALALPGLALAGWPILPSGWHTPLALGAYGLILLRLLLGWVRGFPLWSYLCAGYAFVFAWFLSSVSTPGLRLFGYTFAPGEAWGWRPWVGLAAVAVVALLLTRSLRPPARFFTGMWRQPVRLSLALYGTLPLVMWVLSDEVHQPARAWVVTATASLLAGVSVAAMRSTTPLRRMVSLLAGLGSAWLAETLGLSAYWNGPRIPGRLPFQWQDTAVPMAIAGAVVLAAVLLPAALGLLRQARPRQPA